MGRLIGMLAATVLAAVALAGCSAPAGKPAEKPVELTVSVYQLRSDYAIRGAQIEITNRTTHELQITSATFSSDWFATTASSPSAPNPLLAKQTTDFRIALSDGLCEAPTATPVVHVRYTRPDGSSGSVTVIPTIPFQSISMVHAQDCAQQAFEKVVTISIAPALRFDPPEAADGKRAALLDVTFTPTGAAGQVTLHSTEDTTLLAQREGTIRAFELTMSAASAPATITLDYVPEGCLEHRVAEDKVGTLIPMRVDAGGFGNALFSVPVPPQVKAALMDWVGIYCGW